ncbi:hypothetical protein VPH35_063019 [Triticum aestivum]
MDSHQTKHNRNLPHHAKKKPNSILPHLSHGKEKAAAASAIPDRIGAVEQRRRRSQLEVGASPPLPLFPPLCFPTAALDVAGGGGERGRCGGGVRRRRRLCPLTLPSFSFLSNKHARRTTEPANRSSKAVSLFRTQKIEDFFELRTSAN